MRPFSVAALSSKKKAVSMPRTAHPCRIVAPRRRAPSAIAGAVNQPRVELVFARVLEPGLHAPEVFLGLAEIHDAAGAKPGFRLDGAVHPLPQAQALNNQRQLARVAGHFPAPAPVA